MSSYSLALGASIGKNIPWLLSGGLAKKDVSLSYFQPFFNQILVELAQILVELTYILIVLTWAMTKVSKSSRMVQISSLALYSLHYHHFDLKLC